MAVFGLGRRAAQAQAGGRSPVPGTPPLRANRVTKARYAAVEWWRKNSAEGNAMIAEVLQWGVADVEPILGGETNPGDGTLYMYRDFLE